LQAAVSDLAAVLALLVLAIWVFLRVSRVYGATLFLAFLAIASAGGAPPLWLYSATRYVAVWFPVFIGLAVLVARRPWAAGALAVALAAAQVQLLTLFATGQWAG
ncbi:MAG TPA: hypothetical protein VGR61_03620, partial [Candidatus Dormibacteraeota bacterium]|nr:hypothetical protein [Candidatus Dormibacteraeota bacterium]